MKNLNTDVSDNESDMYGNGITGNSFSGSIVADGQEDSCLYMPAISGIYRLDFSAGYSDTDYRFYIFI
ncbi:MAG: hypothetical protein NC489_42350 [Ruminococcus flavefaciens]|nr:hypothetical protein [Ruminococcus flavefaciens]